MAERHPGVGPGRLLELLAAERPAMLEVLSRELVERTGAAAVAAYRQAATGVAERAADRAQRLLAEAQDRRRRRTLELERTYRRAPFAQPANDQPQRLTSPPALPDLVVFCSCQSPGPPPPPPPPTYPSTRR